MSTSVRALAVVVVTGAYFAYVCQFTNGAPFAYGLSAWHDSYFINALLEHWYRSLLRFENPVSPPMFYPASATLGYSHALILFAPFYAAVRPFVDAFLAHTLTIFLVAELGAVCLYALMRRAGVGFWEALVLTMFFVTSANVIHPGTGLWSQRMSVFLIPPVLLLLSTAFGMSSGAFRLIAGALAGLFATLLLTQEFYTAALAILVFGMLAPGLLLSRLFVPRGAPDALQPTTARRAHEAWIGVGVVLVFVALLIRIDPIDRIDLGVVRFSARDPWRPLIIGLLCLGWYAERRWGLLAMFTRRVRAVTPADRLLAAAIAMGALVGCGAFLWVYLGSLREHREFPEDHLWGQLHHPGFDWRHPLGSMRDLVAFDSVRTLVLVVVLTLLSWIPRFQVDRTRRWQLVWLSVVTMIVAALPLRIDAVSVWKETFGWLPGFSAIRDPKRVIYIYELAAVIGLAVVLSGVARRSAFRLVALSLAGALLAVNWNSQVFDFIRARQEFEQWVRAPIAIDPSCRSFFVKRASRSYESRSDNTYSLYATDALFIALDHRIPTLNGYSAWVPPEYRMQVPDDPYYRKHLKDWIQRNQLQGVCALDIEARTMTPFQE